MIQDLLDKQIWRDCQLWRADAASLLTPTQIRVLFVNTALTRFIEQKYGLRLDVHLHDQYVSFASETEAGLLQIGVSERCLRRKVSLMSRNEVMFDAESLLPLDVLPVALMEELEAGRRPLADLLSDRGLSLSRSNLSIALVNDEGFYDQCWARRSVLSSEAGAKALVTEVFHPAIWRKLNYLQRS